MFSEMCAVIINVLVRLGKAHAWISVVYYALSRSTCIPGIYFLLVFLPSLEASIFSLLYISRLIDKTLFGVIFGFLFGFLFGVVLG